MPIRSLVLPGDASGRHVAGVYSGACHPAIMRLATREHSIEDRSLQTEASSEASTCSAAPMHERGTALDGKMDQIKESMGVPMDDDSLTSEEQLGQMATKVKANVERVKGKLAQAVDQMKAALRSKRSRRFAK
jgi:uncharacterized protein YjbJ (UPF0337 family)